ncbi:MAG: hypothetical protein A3F68_11160 [Acidobacteria bacterium RIFCSPLOWO2_12_FULL_54_10]|nr:MAG: hypothetical protein A3F68_11160 [Acidobacteria bacterium RIFCSPLOWO2_12_FULL_54_10]
MPDITFSCFQCGQSVRLLSGQKVLKSDTCTKCSADLHCCRNCRFFDPSVHNQCQETQAEWVSRKDKTNYCDYFEACTRIDLVRKPGGDDDQARKKWDSLFNK